MFGRLDSPSDTLYPDNR